MERKWPVSIQLLGPIQENRPFALGATPAFAQTSGMATLEMRYVNFISPGGPEVLTLGRMLRPTPGPGEILIEVYAAGVNRPDIFQRMGTYPAPPGASPVLGLEVAGIVVEAAPDSKWKIGDRVCALTPGGGYAEYCITPEDHALPIPNGMSFEMAAGIPETYFTVWANVFQLGNLKPGETFLVHGGASGIGTTAIQMAHAWGARVFTTAGTPMKCEACRALGAEIAVNYREQDFVDEIKIATMGSGIDVILDMIAGQYTPKNIDLLAYKGRLVQISFQQGSEASVNLAKVMQKRLTITGSTMRSRSIDEKAEIADELLREIWPLLQNGTLKVIVDRTFSLEQAGEAHRYLEQSDHIGKVILQVKSS